jgi:CheY-like chemotaxis protein
MDNATGFGPAPPGGIAPLGTILVDDTQTSVTALELGCAGIPGVDVRTVSSALGAVWILQDGNGPVCRVITDVRMPVMDGFQLVEFIRAHSRGRRWS